MVAPGTPSGDGVDAASPDPLAMLTLLVAIGFLTTLPVPWLTGRSLDPAAFGRSARWFPVVGLLLGGLVAAGDAAWRWLLPPGLAGALTLALAALLTGGLHWDGLMDACDGLFGRHERVERLAIMRDSRVGAFGVLGAGLALLAEWSALAELPAFDRPLWLALAFTLSRWTMVVLMVAFPYARPSGLGAAFRGAGRADLLWATLVAVALAAALTGVAGLVATAGVLVLALALAGLAARRLGGLTGDIYGAVGIVGEIAVLTLGSRLGAAPLWR